MTQAHPEARKTQVLDLLSDGQFHSGEDIGRQLGISRTAVSKHISQLRALGVDVYSVTGKGYQWANPTDLLDDQLICSYLKDKTPTEIHRFNVIESTSTYLKQRVTSLSNGEVCIAEAQTGGRGRQGKSWISPFGANLYLSMYWKFEGGMNALSGLSLVVGIALCQLLKRQYATPAQLKWPNDVYVEDRKLAGILVEVEGQADNSCHCVIGVGLNICMSELIGGIDQPWVNLQAVTSQTVNKNILVAKFIEQLSDTLTCFEANGLAPFINDWQEFDWLKEQAVSVHLGDKKINGIAKGINDHGALLVDVQGRKQAFYGGEVSVRKS